jgi:hypothetical protein
LKSASFVVLPKFVNGFSGILKEFSGQGIYLNSPEIHETLMNPSVCRLEIYIFMFYFPQEPNPEDPLNKEAAEVLQSNRRLFEHNVAKAMRGNCYIGETYFERCLVK